MPLLERSVRPFFISLFVASSALAGFAPAAAAQDNGASETADSLSAVLARADSARERLVQPPGEYGGLRTMDVIRIPFQLFGGAVALGLAGAAGTYYVLDKVLIDPALEARAALAEVGVAAEVHSLGTRSWPGVVLRYEGLSPLFAEVGYSVRQYQHYSAGIELGGDSGLGFEAAGTYDRLRQPHFWGIGPDTRDEDRADYSQDVTDVTGRARWIAADNRVLLSAEAGWERSLTGRGWDDSYADVQDVFVPWLFGLDTSVEYLRFGAGAELDGTSLRNLYQVRGLGASIQWHHYQGLGDTSSRFEHLQGDARAFVPVNDRTILALRVLAEDHLGERGTGVPFTHLARLGDDRGLRGYSGRRFRDLAAAAGQLEWRYEAYWHPGFTDLRLEGFAFVDAGSVGPSLSEIELSSLHVTPGLGLRFLKLGKSKGEVYLGFGGDGMRAGFQIGSTF